MIISALVGPTPPTAAAEHVDPPAQRRPIDATRDTQLDHRWTLFVGAVIGLVLVTEILGRIGRHPITTHATSVTHAATPFSIPLLLVMLRRIGAHVLGVRARA